MVKTAENRFGGIQDSLGRKRWLKNLWNLYENHRANVTQILCSLPVGADKSLAILGAGACIDIDLEKLFEVYEQINLIDIDGEYLDCIPDIQPDIPFERLNKYGAVDLSGIYKRLIEWEINTPNEEAVELAISEVRNYQFPKSFGKYQVICSDCLISQMIMQTAIAMGESHPRLVELILTIRQRHFELMLEQTHPGAYVVLISDIVSSKTVPTLSESLPDQLPQILNQLIESKNFFTGCNPYAIVAMCQSNQYFQHKIKNITMTNPWLWRMDKEKVHLVYGLILEKY